MSKCNDCTTPVPTELVAEGKAFLAAATAICLACDHFKKGSGCLLDPAKTCGCIVKFSIKNGVLMKSTCPAGKW